MSERLFDRRWPWLLAVGVVLLVFLSTFVELRAPGDWDRRRAGTADDITLLSERDDPNLLFIVIDTLRAERLASYGYGRETSPTLDRLAETGIRFDRHLAQSSWTKASMASLWTGLLPARTGITRFDHVLPPAARMPAEVLREAGYQTIGLYRNGWVAPTFGFDQGFEVYKRPLRTPLPPGVVRENPTISEAGTDESTVAAAIEFVRLSGRDRKWFLYLHLMDVHEYLFDEASARFGSAYSDIYDNSILWEDGIVETLLASFAELGALENTLVVVTSDHGEAFGERGFEGHARKVYRETSEIPFIISLPFRLDPGLVVRSRTSNVDVWPTLFELLGIEAGEMDGRSRMPEILATARAGAEPDDEAPAIAHLDQHWARPELDPLPTVAVSEGPLRYVRVEQAGGRVEQLFDATVDPFELRDRSREEPEAVSRLSAVADEYLDLEPTWGDVPTRDIGELELNHLRALGYALP